MVRGLDHVVVAVRDLEAAGQAWADLGFTVTPKIAIPGERPTVWFSSTGFSSSC